MQEEIRKKIEEGANPGHPHGTAGKEMLEEMNEHHYQVTGWGLGHVTFGYHDKILDIGCGGGATLHRLHDNLPEATLYGLDYSRTSLLKCSEENAKAIKHGKLNLVHSSVENMPFSDDAFDKIITVESFYFWPDPGENLKEVYRILKPGGRFLLISEVYDNGELSEYSMNNIRNYHLFNPTPEEFQELFEQAGFTGVQMYFQEGEEWICIAAEK